MSPKHKQIRDKWLDKHAEVTRRVRDKHPKAFSYLASKADPKKLAAGAAGSVLLLLSPIHALLPSSKEISKSMSTVMAMTREKILEGRIKAFVPEENRNLNPDEEWHLAEILSDHFGFPVAGELEGKRLNKTLGMIGGEQHLYRYPGDSLLEHAVKPADNEMFIPSGIAPALGAWGYFSDSEAAFSTEELMRERYYLAVQTFLVPDYYERVAEYRDFFKFRKMLAVNAKTGQAVVAVIGDAGPAPWTGKDLGGSPEVMHELGLAKGMRKGPVLYFFINDPENKVPLGPIE